MAHHWREMDSNYWSRHRETPLGRHVVSAHGPTSSKRHRPREGEMFESLYYRRHRFPAEIIQHAIWLYLRFTLSYRAQGQTRPAFTASHCQPVV